MRKILFITFICIFIVAAELALQDGKASFAATASAKIKIVTEDVDMGEVERNEIHNFRIEVKNVGKETLIINNVSSSCGCLELTDKRWPNVSDPVRAGVEIRPVVVKPGHSIYISARVDTNRVSGQFEKTIHIYSNDPDNKDVVWTVRGNVADVGAESYSARQDPGRIKNPPLQQARQNPGGIKNLPLQQDAKIVMVFHAPGCNDCRWIMQKFLPEIKEKYKGRILIVDYNIDNLESYEFLLSLEDRYDERAKQGFFNPKPPIVFAEGRLLYGAKKIKKSLEEIIIGRRL